MTGCRQLLSGASRDRTGDLLLAKQALSQLSYGPASAESNGARPGDSRAARELDATAGQVWDAATVDADHAVSAGTAQ